MYQVSQDFLDQMRADKRRVDAKLVIDYTDPQIDQSLAVEASEEAGVSYPQQTADGVAQATRKWASLDGSWVLDGSYHLAPEPEDLARYQFGWWGSQLAGAGGAFTSPYPSLTVTHIPRPVHSLRVVGDSARGEWPVDFTIDLYAQDGTLLRSETVTGNAAVEWSMTLPSPVLDVARQVLTITKWSHAGRQAKILEFFTSIQETYLSGDVVEVRLLEEREASQGSLPVGNITANEVRIRLANEGGKFDVTNPTSPLWGLLKPNRRVRAWLGIKGGDGDGQQVAHAIDSQADWEAGTIPPEADTVSSPGDVKLATLPLNSGAETGDLTGWIDDYVSGNTVGVTASDRHSGSYAFVITSPNGGTSSGSGGLQSDPISCQPGDQISGRTWVKGKFHFGVHWCDASGNPISGSYTFPTAGTYADWTQTNLWTITVPDGVSTFRVWLYAYQMTGQTFYDDIDIMVNGAPVYVPQATIVTPPLDLSAVGQAATSVLTWSSDTPGGTDITVETSIDGGQTWAQVPNNGAGVPQIQAGDDLTGKTLLVRITLNTTDTTVTPELHSLSVTVNHEDWVPLGTFWSLDWDSPDDALEATVVARDRLERLRSSTYQPGEVQQNVNLYTLAEQILQDAGLQPGEYAIDSALQTIMIPWAWLRPMSHREALRLVAEAALAVVYADRDGVVRVEDMSSAPSTPVLEITTDDYFPPLQAPSRRDSVANEIVVTTQPLQPTDTPEEVYRSSAPISVLAGQTVTVTVQYNQPPVIEAVASLDNPPAGVSITAAAYYAWGAEVTIENTGASAADVTLVITGRPLSVQGGERAVARDDASITENGILRYEFPANPLVQTAQQAQDIASALLASAKDPRRDLEVEWRGNPALELGDQVTLAGQDVWTIRQEITWAGALSARITGRKVT